MPKKGSFGMLGKHHSEDAKRKISEAFTGQKHPLWGMHPSEETLKKMSESHKGQITWSKGKSFSLEYREKLSNAHKGQISWNKGKKFSEESKKRMSEAHKGNFPSEEARRKMSKAHKGIPFSEDHKAKLREACKENARWKGKVYPQELRERIRQKLKGRKKSDEHIKRVLEANRIKPNKPERELNNLLDDIFPGEYRYVGDGQFILGGKCPDFINVNGKKKIIELFGDYWHRGENPQDRINIFKPFGFNTLVIWERELKDIEQLKLRLLTDADLDLNA